MEEYKVANATKIARRSKCFAEWRIFPMGLILVITSLLSFGQSRQEKTEAIIKKLSIVKNQKMNYKFQLESIKHQAIGNDSVKILNLEKKLTDDEILKRINSAFKEGFGDEDINDIFIFIHTRAFEKIMGSDGTYKLIASQFIDIDNEILEITNNFSKTNKKPIKNFEPIPVDKVDGFYATVGYTVLTEDKDIKLEDNPSLTLKDILEIKKEYSKYNDNRPEISIVLKKEGAQKFYILTKENLGKPIAIVIGKKIVSIPKVQSEIMDGKVNISGNFTEKEIDSMIEKLKGE